MRPSIERPGIAAILLAVIVLVVFGRALAGGFVWDDRPLVSENRLLGSAEGVRTLLTSGFWQTGDRHDRFRSFFRPVVSLSYAADYRLWGMRPFGYHATNLLLHLLCAWVVWGIARAEGLSAGPSLFAGAAFAAHPVHVESVAWISGRTDLLCTLWAGLAFLLHLRSARAARPWATRAASLACFALALGAKEMAVTLPLLVGLERALRHAGDLRNRVVAGLRAGLPYVVVLVAYVMARRLALPAEAEPLYALDLQATVATTLFVVARYATLLLVPVGLDPHYPYAPRERLLDPAGLLATISVALVLCGLALLLRRRHASAFWVALVPIALLPVLAFGRFGDVLLADRFLYFPSIGLALAGAYGLSAFGTAGSADRSGAVTAVAVVIAYAAVAIAQVPVWRDDLTLFSRMVETSPGSAMVRCNLGLALYERGAYARAEEELREAIRISPGYALAYNNLAAAVERRGRLEDALRLYHAALRIAPRQLESRINAASLLVRLGGVEPGISELRELVARHPSYPPALQALAEALADRGAEAEALSLLRRATSLDPLYPNPHYLVGKILFERGETASAAAAMREFLRLWKSDGVHAAAAQRVLAAADP